MAEPFTKKGRDYLGGFAMSAPAVKGHLLVLLSRVRHFSAEISAEKCQGRLISGDSSVWSVVLRAAWLPRAALLSGAGALLGLALINPDAWTAERNLDRYAETGKIDWSYIQGLSPA